MKMFSRVIVAGALALAASSVMAAGSAPVITNACVTFPKAGIARISGMVTDADWDARAVGTLGVGSCLNGTNNVSGVSYVCDVPSNVGTVGIAAVDAQDNFSEARTVTIALGCTYY